MLIKLSFAQVSNYYTKLKYFSKMLALPVCPSHGLPYEHVAFKSQNFLRCQKCQFDPSSSRITVQVEYMRARMGVEKTRERNKLRAKSKSIGKRGNMEVDREIQDEEQIVQRIAEQQVLILEITMKLLTEDKKMFFKKIQNNVTEYNKLLKEYQDLNKNTIFLNKLLSKKLIDDYLSVLGSQGWENLKNILKGLSSCSFLGKRIIDNSIETNKQLRDLIKTNEQSVLKSLQTLIDLNLNSQKSEPVETPLKPQNEKESRQKRSKSFGVLVK